MVSDIPAGDGKTANLFYSAAVVIKTRSSLLLLVPGYAHKKVRSIEIDTLE
jgi:hypothetical protein